MDLYQIIRTLHEERTRLDRIIRRLQELQQPGGGSGSRGAGRNLNAGSRGRKKSRARRAPPPPQS